MGDKGGEKGYSQPKGGAKSARKTPLSAGLSNGSTKSRKGMNVHFEFEDRGGKGDKVANGDRGGKGDKVANGGKNPVTKPIRPLQLRVEEELPKNVTCLLDCEAAQVLEGIQEQMVVLSEDPTIKIPISFDKGLQRAKKGSDYTSPKSVKEALQNLKNLGVADSEICLIANIQPESAEEVFSLVPSLKGKENKLLEPLKSALSELTKIECSA